MRLAVWPGPASDALASALARSGVVTETVTVEPHEARALLDAGGADLALLTALDVFRRPDGLAVVPGVALAGEKSDRRVLVVQAPLDQIATVRVDPRDQQDALLTQLVLREHYGLALTFTLGTPAMSLAEWLAGADAALVPLAMLAGGLPPGAYALDVGQEFVDLTIRPMPWGLVAALPETLAPAQNAALADAARTADPDDDRLRLDGVTAFQLTLDGYAQDGLEQLALLWFQTGALPDVPEVPFGVTVKPEADEGE